MPRVGRVAYTPPVPVYRVTALPGPGECSRKETAIDQAAGSTGAEVRNPTERVSFGVVKVLADGTHATGFVAGESGLIVTHGLVVSGASGPRVEMHDGESFQGRVVGVDNRSGLAYLEVRADRDLTPVSLGNSDEVCVGDNVTAVGFSGQGESESLKAHHGQVTTARDGYFRIDSSLNDEILGGPFLNAAGDVIGVSGSGIVIQNGVAAKIVSFVIPINIVKGHLADGLPEATAAPADNLALFPTRTPPPPATPLPSPALLPTPAVVIPTPTPSPTPFPTATPTPTLIPAPAPTATATPGPQPTSTPTQTATPRATTVPRPTPRSSPAVRPTSTPTPTPYPTPVPLSTAGYRNSTIGYSIAYPLGWDVNPARNGNTVIFTSPERDAYIEVSVEDVFSDWSLGEFVDHYRQGLGSQARSWELFNQVSATGEYRESTNYVHLEYRRQQEPDSCVEDVVTHLYRSRYFPAKLRGYAVTMSICDYSLEEYSDTRETVLSGFREFQTE